MRTSRAYTPMRDSRVEVSMTKGFLTEMGELLRSYAKDLGKVDQEQIHTRSVRLVIKRENGTLIEFIIRHERIPVLEVAQRNKNMWVTDTKYIKGIDAIREYLSS